MKKEQEKLPLNEEKKKSAEVSRRDFLMGAGTVVAGGIISSGLLAGCKPETVTTTVEIPTTKSVTKTVEIPTTIVSTVQGSASTVTTTKTVTETGSTKMPWLPDKWDYETDVVVAGTGYAGLTAALAVKNAGKDLIVVEKAPEEYAGGNSSVSVGGAGQWTVREEGIFDVTHACYDAGGELIETLVDVLPTVPDQMMEIGIELTANVTNTKPTYKIKLPDGTQGPGSELWTAIMKVVTDRGIKPMYETPVTRLIQDCETKEILGVQCTQSGKDIYIKAKKGVILAIGGYEANQEMWGWYNYPGIEVYPGGTPYNTGDGIKMMSEVGAPIWHTFLREWEGATCAKASRFYGNAVELGRGLNGSIWVNRAGSRFTSETTGFTHLRPEIAPVKFQSGVDVRPGLWHGQGGYPNMPYYLICDETLRASKPFFPAARPGKDTKWIPVKMDINWSSDNSAEVEKGWIEKADTLDELAGKIGVDADGLKATVAQWNEYCAAGEDPDFGVPASALVPIVTPPFYGMECGLSLINTMGGPQHDAKARTLDRNKEPIPRLYSPGEFGSMFNLNYPGAINIPEALSFGRIAAEHACTLDSWE